MHERIPRLADDSLESMNLWFNEMANRNMIFHPEDAADSIVCVQDGGAFFSKEEADEVQHILDGFFNRFGNVMVNDVAYPHFMRAAGMQWQM